MRIGLREANQHFSKAIKAVKAGRHVVLTERGRPIAVIKPIAGEHGAAAIRRMIEEGVLQPGNKSGQTRLRHWKPIRMKGVPLSQTLREERDAR